MLPGVEWLEEVDAAEERRLAAPARPDHDEHLAARDLEVDAVEHEVVPEALDDAVEPQQRLVRRLDGGHTGRLTPLHHWLHTRRGALGQGRRGGGWPPHHGVDNGNLDLVKCLSRMSKTETRPGHETEQALLDAAERLLVEVGAAGITTRRVAEEAGANHGLVHYYFGSVEQLLVRVLERFTERLIERQRQMYAADMPFLEKWRTAMAYLDEDRPYQKIWFELQALSWNRPELRERLVRVHAEWRAVLSEAFAPVRDELGLDVPLEALVSLVYTFNEGIMLDRLSGIETEHRELLDWIDAWLERRMR